MGDLLNKRLAQTKAFDNPALEAILNVMLAAGWMNEWNDRVCASQNITRSQYNVLRILRGAYPSGRTRQDITRRMIDRSPDVTRLIDRLEAAGYVERERTDTDRRLSIARITEQGLALLNTLEPEYERVYAEMNARLTESELHQLSALCEKIYGLDGVCG